MVVQGGGCVSATTGNTCQSPLSALIPGFPRTAAEIAAGVTPVNYGYPPLNVLRYENNTTPGTTDMTAGFSSAFSVCKQLVPSGSNVNWGAVYVTVSSTESYGVSSISIPSGCGIISNDGTAEIIALSSAAAAVIDTPVLNSGNTPSYDTSIVNIYIHGPGPSGTVSGLRLNNVQEGIVQNVSFDNLPGPALVINSKADGTAYTNMGIATSLTGGATSQGLIVIQTRAFNCLQNTGALTQRTGIFNIMGTDNIYSQDSVWNPISRSLSGVNKYSPAWDLVGVSGNRFATDEGSVSDQGWYIDSNSFENFFTNIRALANLAEGLDIAGSTNWFDLLELNGNGQAANNTYDQLVFETSAQRNFVSSGAINNDYGGSNSARYDITDNNTSVGSQNHIGSGVLIKDAATGGINDAGSALSLTLADSVSQRLSTNSTTPSVLNGNQPYKNWITNNTVATTITNFTGGVSGQILLVEGGDSNTTIQNGANIKTTSGSNISLAISSLVQFRLNSSNVWVQF